MLFGFHNQQRLFFVQLVFLPPILMCEQLPACSQTLTVICQEIPISVWSDVVLIGSVAQSAPTFIQTLPGFKASRNYVPWGCCFTLFHPVGEFCLCRGHRGKSWDGRKEQRFKLSIFLKIPPNKRLWEITLIKCFLQTIEWHHLLFRLWIQPPLFLCLPLYLTLWELMELLWWWCMGVCVNRQMGKCNYGCFRTTGE